MTWYVVCDEFCSYEYPERDTVKVWTVSRDPNKTGWNTDSGHPGYGLTRADAEFLAAAANQAEVLADLKRDFEIAREASHLFERASNGWMERALKAEAKLNQEAKQ